MSELDYVFLIIALTNTGIGVHNSELNHNQKYNQENIQNQLDKIYSKLLQIEEELKHTNGNE